MDDTGPQHEMIAVPAGRVTLSDRRSLRTWTVELAGYRLAAHPVTRELYARVTGRTDLTGRPADADGGARLPVESVSWQDAVHFCNALSLSEGFTPAYRVVSDVGDGVGGIDWDASADGYRLPTEAEWEHACRAGTDGPRYGPLDDIAWYRANSGERIQEVGGRRPNSWGLHDMLGNVWEWCWDLYDPEVYGAYRVLRGGGWFDEHWSCRASVRRRSHPTFRVDDVGFRVARSVPGAAG
ncbi:formylglycine-generating enzyme family protein [Streptomyces sp. NBC_01275]|uniref:formylglycine-generating enzyme family protein n=1 Tax=Streptomyces sp. NBC_01275 TaxID=2903807 RepID=UPI002253DD79|nr:SUMF1/EgtB/PvdO family nonheme iron enzyme [Streptomyces sp. NBC_01275]MCX4766892.1 formylglycine-generating enzyme family protein [Streptomyces sp. NBC_01275]